VSSTLKTPRRPKRQPTGQEQWRKRSATPEHVAQRTAQRGWLFETLVALESVIHGRWRYWLAILDRGTISGPVDVWAIPQVPFADTAASHQPTLKPWGLPEPSADLAAQCGSRAEAVANIQDTFGWAFARGARLDEVVEWWLWAFGSSTPKQKPKLDPAVEVRLYCGVELHRLIAHPADWAAHIATLYYGDNGGRHCGWFPTPISLCNLTVAMTFGQHPEADLRTKTCVDPCVGTGAMLLPASNYSLRISGMDIDRTMVMLCQWQAYLYVPWMIVSGEGIVREFTKPAGELPQQPNPVGGQLFLFGDS
jgi:hypothetical protein